MEEVETFVFRRISQEFPQLDIDDIHELMDIVAKNYELNEDNVVKIEKYISEKIIVDDRKSFINTDLDLYHQCCESNVDDGEAAMNDYIERFKEKYGFSAWKTRGYFSDPEKFDCGKYKEVFVWCE